jgi:hypothetical protein
MMPTKIRARIPGEKASWRQRKIDALLAFKFIEPAGATLGWPGSLFSHVQSSSPNQNERFPCSQSGNIINIDQ